MTNVCCLPSAGLPAGNHSEHQQDRRPHRVRGEPDPEERSAGRRADRRRAGGASLLLPGSVRQSGPLPPPPRQQTPGQCCACNLHPHFLFTSWCLVSFSSSWRSWRRRGNCQTGTQTWRTRPIWPTGPPGGTRGRRRRRWRRRFQQRVESQLDGRSCVTSWFPLWSGRDGRPRSAWTPSRWSGTTRSTWEDLHRTRTTRTPPSSAPCQVIMFPLSSVNYSLWLESCCVSVTYIISRCSWARSQFRCFSLPRLPQNISEKELLRVTERRNFVKLDTAKNNNNNNSLKFPVIATEFLILDELFHKLPGNLPRPPLINDLPVLK